MRLRKKNEPSDQPEDEDLTDELLEWARVRGVAVPETMPDTMEPSQGTKSEPELQPSGWESVPSAVETAAPIKPQQQPKILVVTLDESATDRAQAYLFDDTQGASQFIETLVKTGLNPDRIIVFWATPMNFNVTCGLVVTTGEPELQPTVSS